MDPISLAARTDLAVLGPASRVDDEGDHLVVRSPDNPGFIWGNYLLFSAPPSAGDLPRWCRLYDEAFRHSPGRVARTFTWDRADGFEGAALEFVDAGFALERTDILVCRRALAPPRRNPGLDIRPLEGDLEYGAAVDMQVQSREPCFAEAPYRRFRLARMAAYRLLVAEGRGQWWGAFLDGTLVGDLGLFVVEGLGRYQFVTTDPAHRRRGVCSTLLAVTATAALARPDVHALVIAADPEGHARAIYESVGFTHAEWQLGLTRGYPDGRS